MGGGCGLWLSSGMWVGCGLRVAETTRRRLFLTKEEDPRIHANTFALPTPEYQLLCNSTKPAGFRPAAAKSLFNRVRFILSKVWPGETALKVRVALPDVRSGLPTCFRQGFDSSTRPKCISFPFPVFPSFVPPLYPGCKVSNFAIDSVMVLNFTFIPFEF